MKLIFLIIVQMLRYFRTEDYFLSEIKAEVAKALHEHHDQKFAVFTIVCPLYEKRVANIKVKLPQSVAIQYKTNSLSHLSPTFIPIRYVPLTLILY